MDMKVYVKKGSAMVDLYVNFIKEECYLLLRSEVSLKRKQPKTLTRWKRFKYNCSIVSIYLQEIIYLSGTIMC